MLYQLSYPARTRSPANRLFGLSALRRPKEPELGSANRDSWNRLGAAKTIRAGTTGFEPAASGLTGRRALQAAPRPHGAPRGIRIPVTALKGRRPRPLDDGGRGRHASITRAFCRSYLAFRPMRRCFAIGSTASGRILVRLGYRRVLASQRATPTPPQQFPNEMILGLPEGNGLPDSNSQTR
jgi:hypothetical protein